MTVTEYIRKHGLLLRTPGGEGWIPEYGVPDGHEAVYHATDDAMHVAVIDKTNNTFKIIHEEPVRVQTDWLDCAVNYETDVRPFW